MPSILPHGQPIIIVHRTKTGIDGRGNDILTETQETIDDCAFAAGSSSEEVAGTEEVATNVNVWFPDGTTITPIDAFILPDGSKYEVQGSPNQFKSPWTGIVSYVEVQGRYVIGASV